MEITLLGTGCASPSVDRWHPAIAVRFEKETLLFDCGECAQIRLQQADINPMKINRIFITHFHGDHCFGLPGLLFSMSLGQRIGRVEIYGPRGAKRFMKHMLALGVINLGFELVVKEISAKKQKKICESDRYEIFAVNTPHSIENLAYCFKEKDSVHINEEKMKKMGLGPGRYLKLLKEGKDVSLGGKVIHPKDLTTVKPGRKFVYTGDTMPSPALVELARGADLLVHEATFLSGLKEKAADYTHSTAKSAAETAKKAKVKKLLLMHFSRRYRDPGELLKEAKQIFPNTEIARDLMRLVL